MSRVLLGSVRGRPHSALHKPCRCSETLLVRLLRRRTSRLPCMCCLRSILAHTQLRVKSTKCSRKRTGSSRSVNSYELVFRPCATRLYALPSIKKEPRRIPHPSDSDGL